MSYSSRTDYRDEPVQQAQRVRLTKEHRDQIFWERIDPENEILVTGDRVVEVPKMTARISDAMRQGILETGFWELSPVLPDISEIMKTNDEIMLDALRFSRQMDLTTNMKREEAARLLEKQAARFGLTVVPLELGEEGEEYETSNRNVIRQSLPSDKPQEPKGQQTVVEAGGKKLYGAAAAQAAKRKAALAGK